MTKKAPGKEQKAKLEEVQGEEGRAPDTVQVRDQDSETAAPDQPPSPAPDQAEDDGIEAADATQSDDGIEPVDGIELADDPHGDHSPVAIEDISLDMVEVEELADADLDEVNDIVELADDELEEVGLEEVQSPATDLPPPPPGMLPPQLPPDALIEAAPTLAMPDLPLAEPAEQEAPLDAVETEEVTADEIIEELEQTEPPEAPQEDPAPAEPEQEPQQDPTPDAEEPDPPALSDPEEAAPQEAEPEQQERVRPETDDLALPDPAEIALQLDQDEAAQQEPEPAEEVDEPAPEAQPGMLDRGLRPIATTEVEAIMAIKDQPDDEPAAPPEEEPQQEPQREVEVDPADVLLDAQDQDQATVEEQEPPPVETALAAARAADPTALERLLVAEMKAESDRERKALGQHDLGLHYLRQEKSESKAVRAFATALKLDPTLRPNVWAIRRVFLARQLWPNLLKLLEAQCRLEQDLVRRSEVLVEKGWILQEFLADPTGAKDAFWEAHDANRGWLCPLLALEKLALAQGDFDCLADVYRQMSEAAREPDRRVAVLIDLARLQGMLTDGTPHQALAILEDAYEIGINQWAVLTEMEETAGTAGLHTEQTEVLRRQAEFLLAIDPPDAEGAAARLRKASQLARTQLEDLAEANRLLQAARAALPADRLLQRDMLTLAEERQDWAQVDQLIGEQIAAAQDDVERAALLFQQGAARARAGSPEAGDSLKQATRLVPGYLPVSLQQELNHLAAGNVPGLVDLYLTEAAAVQQGSAGLGLGDSDDLQWCATALWRAAVLLNRRLLEPDRAQEFCRQALSIKPDFRPALDELEDIYRATGQHAHLAALLEEQLSDADEGRAVLLLEQLIDMCGGVLNDPARQLTYLKLLKGMVPNDLRTLRRMAQAYQRLEQFEELDAVLRDLEGLEREPALLASLKLYRARLYEVPLERPQEAIAVYRDVLARMPGHSFAFASLEQLLSREGRHEELAQILRRAADESMDATQKYALLTRLHLVFSRDLNDPARAVEVAAELQHVAAPTDLGAIRNLARAAQAAQDMPRLVQAMEAELEQTEAPEARARLLIRLADLLEDRLDDSERAEALLLRALDEAPQPADVVDALDQLARRRLSRADHAEAATALEQLEQQVPPEAQARIMEERAWLASGPLDQTEQGDQLWSQLLEQQPQHRTALWGIQRIAARANHAQRLCENSERMAGLAESPRLRQALNLRAAVLADAAGTERDVAAQIYRQMLQQEDCPPEAAPGLMARPEVEALEFAQLQQRLAQAAPEPLRQEMRLALALALEQAGQLEAARAELASILEQDPDHLAALVVLRRLVQAVGDKQEESRAWARIAQLSSSRQAQAEAYASAARLQEELEQPADAALLYRHVLGPLPADDNAFARLHELYQRAGDHARLDRLLGHRMSHTEDDLTRLALCFERAALRLEQLDDKPGAAKDLLRVLRIDEAHLEALGLLARLYDDDNNTASALEFYQRYVDAAGTPDLQRAPVLRMAELLHQRQDQPDQAVVVLERFEQSSPGEDEVLQRLGDLHIELKAYPQAVAALERLNELRGADPAWQARNLQRIGRLYWKEMQDHAQARAALQRSRELDPTNIELVEDLFQLLRQMDQQDQVDLLLERAKDDLRAALAQDPLSMELFKKLLRVAEWHQDQYTLLATLGVLCFFNVADPEEQALYSKRIARTSFAPKKQVDRATWQAAGINTGELSPHGQLWSVMVEALPKLYPDRIPGDVNVHGVKKSDKVNRKAGGPVSSRIERIAEAMGITSYDIYLSSAKAEMLAGVATTTPALVFGHSVVTNMDNRQRFRVGRLLSQARNRTFALDQLSAPEQQLLFAAGIMKAEQQVSFGLPQQEVAAEAKRAYKALSRKTRKGLAGAVARLRQEGGDLDRWVRSTVDSAYHCGLLVSGDIIAALEDQLEPLGDSGARAKMSLEQMAQVVRQDAWSSKLLVYSVSREYLTLRRALGV